MIFTKPIFISLIFAAVPFVQPAHADAQADARQIVELTVTENMFGALMQTQGPFIASALENELRKQGIEISDPEKFAAIIVEEMLAEFTREMQDVFTIAYQSNFTATELADIRAFYDSPSGAALLAKTPQLMQIGAQNGTVVGQKAAINAQARVATRLEAENIQVASPSMTKRLIDALK